ncbi:hypothetical protein D3C76_1670620 [compost metagenome]
MLELVDIFSGLLQLHQYLARVGQVDLPRFGQGDAPGGTLEQARSQFGFQMGHGAGQGRGGLAQVGSGAGETALVGSGHEHGDGAQLVH